MRIEQNYSLLNHNTFHLDVKARYFVEYESEEDLQKLLTDEYFMSETFWHIGEGSNLLFLGDFKGIIVHSAIKGIEVVKETDEHVWLKVGAGENWDSFVAYCVAQGWGGIENLSNIPGEVGASAYQNIGAYGAEVADCIEEVQTYFLETGKKRMFSKEECQYAYRHSFFKEEKNKGLYYITHVVYRLDKHPVFKLDYGNLRSFLKEDVINLQTIREAVIAIRNAKLPDPKEIGNAGSFFKNPFVKINEFEKLRKNYPEIPFYPVDDQLVKIPAAWLIEQCGMKKKSVGGAAVYEKQALILINRDHAIGEEIALLATEIQNAVKDKFSIELEPEVIYI
jgi:UDP-N-acetylenolpyruvoylglucosamine reductase